MEFQKVIETRRSVRKYDGEKKVSKDMVIKLIEAAVLAPSWKNSQTARYYCVMSEDGMERFERECLPEFNAKNSSGASALIVTAYKKNVAGFAPDFETPSNELGNGWGIYDLGLQNQNLVLKAADMGLSTLIMGIRDADKIRRMLDIPEDEQIVAVIAVGYGADTPKRPARKSIEEIAEFF